MKVLMPESLTAENGAKAALSGEFYMDVLMADGAGGEIFVKVPVSWTTIKEIYKKAVELLGEKV